jgi:hypothetical protein
MIRLHEGFLDHLVQERSKPIVEAFDVEQCAEFAVTTELRRKRL